MTDESSLVKRLVNRLDGTFIYYHTVKFQRPSDADLFVELCNAIKNDSAGEVFADDRVHVEWALLDGR